MVDELGIHTVDDKISAVSHFPQPKSVDNVRSFLGLAGYYRPFIRNFAAIANPLTKLLKKDTPFEWSKTQESSFNQLMEALTKAPLLVFPQFTDPFLLCTDASTINVGAALMQTDGDSICQPCLNASGKKTIQLPI